MKHPSPLPSLHHSLLPTPLASLPASTSFIPEDNAVLSDEITRLAGHINAAQHRFLTLLAALIERNAWEGAGMKSPAHWLNYHCGIDLGAAREKVRVAKSLQNFPGIDEAFRTGEISYSKVRAMTRSATPQNEAFLLQIARHGTAQHMEQLVRRYRRTERLNDAARDRSNHEAREFTCYFDEDDMLVLRGRLTPEDGAVFMKAMDAMMAIAEQAVSTMEEGLKPVSSAEKYQVVVHIERERVEVAGEVAVHANTHVDNHADRPHTHSHPDHQQCSIECGTHHFPLSAATARRLCCDASMVTVLEDFRRNVLNVGRRTRTIPPSIRRALQVRDGGCRFPGCCESRYVDADRITETLAIEREHDQVGLQIDARTAVTLWQGERTDYGMAVGAMMTRGEIQPDYLRNC